MVRILNNNGKIHITFSDNQKISKNEWKFLIDSCNSFFKDKNYPIIIELGKNMTITQTIHRAFKLFYKTHKNPLIIIAAN